MKINDDVVERRLSCGKCKYAGKSFVLRDGTEVKKFVKQSKDWEWKDKNNTRPVRSQDQGLLGQALWHYLQLYGFVNNDASMGRGLSSQEKMLKRWLIWGYWEED